MPDRAHPASLFRGFAVAGFTAPLAVVAHGAVSDSAPTGGALTLLVLLAAGLGAMASSWHHSGRRWPLLGMLAGGQVGGHFLLSAGGHHHVPQSASAWLPAPVMLAAHLAAVVLGAILVAGAERLCAALSIALRGGEPTPHIDVTARPLLSRKPADHPLRRTLLMTASISHRGPPAA